MKSLFVTDPIFLRRRVLTGLVVFSLALFGLLACSGENAANEKKNVSEVFDRSAGGTNYKGSTQIVSGPIGTEQNPATSSKPLTVTAKKNTGFVWAGPPGMVYAKSGKSLTVVRHPNDTGNWIKVCLTTSKGDTCSTIPKSYKFTIPMSERGKDVQLTIQHGGSGNRQINVRVADKNGNFVEPAPTPSPTPDPGPIGTEQNPATSSKPLTVTAKKNTGFVWAGPPGMVYAKSGKSLTVVRHPNDTGNWIKVCLTTSKGDTCSTIPKSYKFTIPMSERGKDVQLTIQHGGGGYRQINVRVADNSGNFVEPAPTPSPTPDPGPIGTEQNPATSSKPFTVSAKKNTGFVWNGGMVYAKSGQSLTVVRHPNDYGTAMKVCLTTSAGDLCSTFPKSYKFTIPVSGEDVGLTIQHGGSGVRKIIVRVADNSGNFVGD